MRRTTLSALLCAAALSPAAPAHAAADSLFDGNAVQAAPVPAFSFCFFCSGPKTPQAELKAAADGSESAILGLSAAALAQATPDQKVAMLKTLMAYSHPNQGGEGGGNDQNQGAREQAILRLLSSSHGAAAFDRVYYRIDPRNLPNALSDPQPVYDMVSADRASAVPGDWAALDRYIDEVAQTKSSGKNRVQFLIDDGVIAPGLAVIEGAKTSIHLEVFQLQADETGWTVARMLAAKAKAGVRVRLMLDANGSSAHTDQKVEDLIEFLRASGAEVVVKRIPIDMSHLDHRKVMVVDGDTAFTGGMNIGNSYQKDWHDQQTLISGPAVSALQNAFLERWRAAGGAVPDAEIPALYPSLTEQPDGAETTVVAHEGKAKDQNIRAMYLRAIGTAQASIRIANPYFMDGAIVAELVRAAGRGVKVQVVLPEDNDTPIVQRGSRAYYPDLLAAGVQVFEYQGRMAHEKVAVFDSRWSTFGSSNLDSRSLRYNDELNLAVSDPGVARYIEKNLFDEDLKRSKPILHHTPTLRERLDRSLEGAL